MRSWPPGRSTRKAKPGAPRPDGAGVIPLPPDAMMLTVTMRGTHRDPITLEQQPLSGCEVAA
jgi:hypothetical protein